MKCTVRDCNNPNPIRIVKGLCNKHYLRLLRYGDVNRGRVPQSQESQKKRSESLKKYYVDLENRKHLSDIMKIKHNGFKKGHIPWQTGKKLPERSGINHFAWAGDDVGYYALHSWVRRQLGQPKICSECGFESENIRQFHWANISREYRRDLDDWIRLCVKCHKAYDMNKLTLAQAGG